VLTAFASATKSDTKTLPKAAPSNIPNRTIVP